VPISLEECRTIHAGYWELYAGVKEYEKELLRQLNNNNGWVLNGLGRPLGIAPDLEKDIVNRVVQSTGHDILVQWLNIYSTMLQGAGIPYTSIIADLHDESIIEVPEHHAEQALKIMSVDAIRELNRQLGGRIPLKGEGMIAHCLADIKIEG
jgi:DNA polymerase I-like protein with 3'-5' exonuclease and polymerase domains